MKKYKALVLTEDEAITIDNINAVNSLEAGKITLSMCKGKRVEVRVSEEFNPKHKPYEA